VKVMLIEYETQCLTITVSVLALFTMICLPNVGVILPKILELLTRLPLLVQTCSKFICYKSF